MPTKVGTQRGRYRHHEEQQSLARVSAQLSSAAAVDLRECPDSRRHWTPVHAKRPGLSPSWREWVLCWRLDPRAPNPPVLAALLPLLSCLRGATQDIASAIGR
jgi:hypothetical protein